MRIYLYENERWAPIAGFEELYEVSDHGRVRSLDRLTSHRRGPRRLCGMVLRPTVSRGNPYPFVSLWKGGIKRAVIVRIHLLVAAAFLVKPFSHEKLEINHINGDKQENHFVNLEWTTKSGNSQHAWDTGLRSVAPKYQFTDGQLAVIREGNIGKRKLAKLFNASVWIIMSIRRGDARYV